MSFSEKELLPEVHHIKDAMGVCFTLLTGTKRALLVDAGYGLEDVSAMARGLTDRPVTLALTHGHHDHALGAMWFDEFWLNAEDREVFARYTSRERRKVVLDSADSKGLKAVKKDYLDATMPVFRDIQAEPVTLGEMTVYAIHVAGHTPGSTVFYVPERRLLLSGDDWNPCTWLFFPEALDVWTYKENMEALLMLPFDYVLCPHRDILFERSAMEVFVHGITAETISAAKPVDLGKDGDRHEGSVPSREPGAGI